MIRMVGIGFLQWTPTRPCHVTLALAGIQTGCGPHVCVDQAPLQVFACLLNDRPDLAIGHCSIFVALVRQLQGSSDASAGTEPGVRGVRLTMLAGLDAFFFKGVDA